MSGSYAPIATSTEGLEGSHSGFNKARQQPRGQLRRDVSLLDATVMVVGNIIGTGIFSSPGVALAACNSIGFSLLAWVIGGVLATASSLVYSELGAMMPRAGGDYVYISAAFGSRPAFMWAASQFTVYRPTSLAVNGLVFGRYAAALLLPRSDNATAGGESTATEKAFAACFVLALTAFNILPIGLVARTQTVVTVLAKPTLVLGLVALAVAFSVLEPATLSANFEAPFQGARLEGLAPAVFASLYAYNGWFNVTQMAEEMKEPQRQLPRAIMLGMITCAPACHPAYLPVCFPVCLPATHNCSSCRHICLPAAQCGVSICAGGFWRARDGRDGVDTGGGTHSGAAGGDWAAAVRRRWRWRWRWWWRLWHGGHPCCLCAAAVGI